MPARRQFVESLEIAGPQFTRDPVFLVQPLPEIQQSAAFRAEWPGRRCQPVAPTATSGARHLGQGLTGVHRFNQRKRALRRRLKTRQVTIGKWNEKPGRWIEMSPGKPPRVGCHSQTMAPNTIKAAPKIISCLPKPGATSGEVAPDASPRPIPSPHPEPTSRANASRAQRERPSSPKLSSGHRPGPSAQFFPNNRAARPRTC